jgi:hypothetical protein
MRLFFLCNILQNPQKYFKIFAPLFFTKRVVLCVYLISIFFVAMTILILIISFFLYFFALTHWRVYTLMSNLFQILNQFMIFRKNVIEKSVVN